MIPWPIIGTIVLATFVPSFLWGYRRGYKRATSDQYGPAMLQQSAAELGVNHSPKGRS